ncbi:5'/3'-nucleotidase SurE [uncultured Cardiobacterium sp.]|uniref:5'/3'-nucleotidase SurE n=1 Tax=uncultured Cardiobacterium sp. TaxID=417619 RepID=UPI00261AA83A|nr:5'/3'-nucleotidase SurE [uncultured Cardiobacterium sp.]
MFLLLSNDDGYLAPGLRRLADALHHEVNRLAVIAPDRDCSGASHSLTLKRPLSITEHGANIWSVDGTPSDCVHLALTGYLDTRPDMVISGINHGANMGEDVLYSGTVAAAFEGHNLGLPAIAVSIAARNPAHLDSAVKITTDLYRHMSESPLPRNLFLNINIPDLPYKDIKGIRATVLGARHPAGPLQQIKNPRDKILYWIGSAGNFAGGGDNTDFHAVEAGYVSVTPLQFDLTAHDQLHDLGTWLEDAR